MSGLQLSTLLPCEAREKVPEGRMRAGLRSEPVSPQARSMTFTPHRTVARARSLRRGQTPAEQRLWGYLRGRRLGGHKFARQVPVGAYIADFVCREPKLVVEVDGATHSEDSEISYDARRERFLKAEGYKVLRVLNDDVYNRVGDGWI